MTSIAEAPVRRVQLAGGLVGFALGGFFDGILLHQILQWHHLLSAIDPDNARMQVMADGLFHALMYVLALAGLWLLWRAVRDARVPTVPLIVAVLAGFGAWHLVDAVMSHWLLGIHRIRMDTATPLLWEFERETRRTGAPAGRPRAAAVAHAWCHRPRLRLPARRLFLPVALLTATRVGPARSARRTQMSMNDGGTT